MRIKIVTIGTKPRTNVSSLITMYLGRLPRDYHLEWVFVKHGVGDTNTSMAREAEKILKHVTTTKNSLLILLDEAGKQLTSPEFAEKFLNTNQELIFIIGGAYGVDKSVLNRADFVWSLSKLVLPHQLVRIILAEQIYRAYSINTGHPYHHS